MAEDEFVTFGNKELEEEVPERMKEMGKEQWKIECEDKLRTAKKEADLVSHDAWFKAMTESEHFVDMVD